MGGKETPSPSNIEGNVVLNSSKHESITFPHEFTFLSVQYFIEAILLKNAVKKGRIRKKVKKVGHIGKQELFMERGAQTFQSKPSNLN